MNAFDTSILDFLNRLSQRWHWFDKGVVLLSGTDLLKGGLFMAALWWLWFRTDQDDTEDRRSYLIAAIPVTIVAVVATRVVAHVLPFRDRPMFTSGYHFVLPYGAEGIVLDSWSSFPSDNAVLFFALATSLWFVSRRIGVLAALYATFAVCLPRVYLGEHWPTDILAGAAIGVGLGWLGARERVRTFISRPALLVLDREPGWFYAAFFLLTYQTATLFENTRDVAHFALHTLKDLL